MSYLDRRWIGRLGNRLLDRRDDILAGSTTLVEVSLPEDDDEPVMASFHLVYHGPLSASKQKKKGQRRELQQEIRRQIHEQIQALFDHRPSLEKSIFSKSSRKWVGDFIFFPLVSSHLGMLCELDIIFLRREPPGALFNQGSDYGGDLDNRLKVFLDALRMPKDLNELPQSLNLPRKQRIFFCLLEDDALVSRIQITSAAMLEKLEPGHEKDVRLIVEVTIKYIDQESSR